MHTTVNRHHHIFEQGPIGQSLGDLRWSLTGNLQQHATTGIIAAIATLAAVWSWQLLPVTQLPHAIAAWLGLGAIALIAMAFSEAGGRALATAAVIGTLVLSLVMAGTSIPILLAPASALLALGAGLLAPHGELEPLRPALWHYALLTIMIPIVL